MIKEKTRNEIEEKYKWDLSTLYKNEEEFNKELLKAKELIEKVTEYKGKLTKTSDNLYNFLKLEEEITIYIENLYVYASCKYNEDVSVSENQQRQNKVLNLDTLYSEKSNFVMPELMKTDYKVIEKYINENDKLKEFKFDLEKIYRYQKHTLTDNEELLLSKINELSDKYKTNFGLLTNSLIDFGKIKDEDNNEVELTIGNYSKYIRSKDRRVRKEAFYTRYRALEKYCNILSVNYEGHLKADSINAKAKKYDSSLHMYLFPDGMTEKAYDNLLDIADKNIEVLYKYHKLIKKVSKIDDFKVYDLSVPLTKGSSKKYTPEDAKKIILEALSVYGDEYKTILKKAFDERWIDFYTNKGKRAGYYETMGFNTHPVVFGNFTDDFMSVSAICHELGHAMNSYFSDKNQPPHLSHYRIIVAEVASLTNEMVLSNYIVKNSKDKQEKLLAIENILEVFSNNFFGTLSEGSIFEKIVHKKIDNNETLSDLDFNKIFKDIASNYYGPDVELDDCIKYNWCRIPHFYTSFYYYKYSIGVACACYCANKIINGDNEFLEKYLKFLTLGDSMMPMDELKTIGIDLEKKEVIEDAIKYFDNLIDEFEKIYYEK